MIKFNSRENAKTKDWNETIKFDDVLEFFQVSDGNSFHSELYLGRKSKPTYNYRYDNFNTLKKNNGKRIAELIMYDQKSKVKKEELKELNQSINIGDYIKPGDIFVESWGYTMTAYDYYQVIEILSAKTVLISKISKSVDNSKDNDEYGSFYSKPIINSFKGEPFKARMSKYYNKTFSRENMCLSLSDSKTLFLWDGKSLYENHND